MREKQSDVWWAVCSRTTPPALPSSRPGGSSRIVRFVLRRTASSSQSSGPSLEALSAHCHPCRVNIRAEQAAARLVTHIWVDRAPLWFEAHSLQGHPGPGTQGLTSFYPLKSPDAQTATHCRVTHSQHWHVCLTTAGSSLPLPCPGTIGKDTSAYEISHPGSLRSSWSQEPSTALQSPTNTRGHTSCLPESTQTHREPPLPNC